MRGKKVVDQEAHLWSMVNKTPLDECWNFTGCKSHGYGAINVRGKRQFAHRLAWIYTYGPIPEGMFVCHKCDNPACCNPNHLFLGTQDDNMRDASEKLRCHIGEKNYNAKLTEEQVKQIVQLANENMTRKELGQRFGVSRQTINSIINGHDWKYLNIKSNHIDRSHGANHPVAKLNSEIVREIRHLYQQGQSQRSLSRKYSVSHRTIHQIITRETWKDVI